jgi:hypothetical protein
MGASVSRVWATHCPFCSALVLALTSSSCHGATRKAPLPSAASPLPSATASQSAPAPVSSAERAPATAAVAAGAAAPATSLRISAAPVQLSKRTLQKLVAGPGDKKCRFDIEYPQIQSGDASLNRAVNRRLAPAQTDIHCTADDVTWDGDNGLSGTGQPSPKVFERTGRYEVHFNDRQLLAVQLTLFADTGTAHGLELRDEVLVLDLAADGRELPLSAVLDRKRDPNGWASRVQDTVKRALAPDLTVVEWVASVAADTDRYVVSNAGIALCPAALPSALTALATCSYSLSWGELSSFWIAGNPLERLKPTTGAHPNRSTK